MRYYSFQFRVGGRKSGYDCTIEVKAKNRKAAAQRIRNRIKKMPDVEDVPVFRFDEVTVGLAVLESDGHDDNGYCKRKRPAKLVDKPAPILPTKEKK